MNVITTWVKKIWEDEEGLGTLEMLLIVAVLIGIALLFRDQITLFVEKLLKKSETEIDNF